jgi:hypothetical protein
MVPALSMTHNTPMATRIFWPQRSLLCRQCAAKAMEHHLVCEPYEFDRAFDKALTELSGKLRDEFRPLSR